MLAIKPITPSVKQKQIKIVIIYLSPSIGFLFKDLAKIAFILEVILLRYMRFFVVWDCFSGLDLASLILWELLFLYDTFSRCVCLALLILFSLCLMLLLIIYMKAYLNQIVYK